MISGTQEEIGFRRKNAVLRGRHRVNFPVKETAQK